MSKFTSQCVMGKGWQKWNEVPGPFGRENPGQTGRGQDVALGDGLGLNQFQSGPLQADFPARNRLAKHDRLRGDINHSGFSPRVNMGQFLHLFTGLTDSMLPFQSLTTARICSAALSFGFTCFRLYQGNMPSKSGVTRI